MHDTYADVIFISPGLLFPLSISAVAVQGYYSQLSALPRSASARVRVRVKLGVRFRLLTLGVVKLGISRSRCFAVFTSAEYRTSPRTNFSVPVAYCCIHSIQIGLLQQCPVWTPC